MSKKKKSIAALGSAIAEREKNSTDQTSAVQQLVEAYLSTNNEAKRAKKIAEIKSRCGGLNELLSQNSELLTAEVEQALLRAATVYTRYFRDTQRNYSSLPVSTTSHTTSLRTASSV